MWVRLVMISKRDVPHGTKDKTIVRGSYVRFFWPVLRSIALIVALWAFVTDLPALLYWGKWGPTWPAFAIASFALIAMTPRPETLPAIEGEGEDVRRCVPWLLLIYCAITGLGYTWGCVFLWFSRKYTFLSGPVIGTLTFVLVSYGVVGLVVGRLTGGNWRTALLVLALAPCAISGIVLRLGLLR